MKAPLTATGLRCAFRELSGGWLVAGTQPGALPVPVIVASSMAGAPLVAVLATTRPGVEQVARLLWQLPAGLPLVGLTGTLREPDAADLARLHRRASAIGVTADNSRARTLEPTGVETVDPSCRVLRMIPTCP